MKLGDLKKANELANKLNDLESRINRLKHYEGRLLLKFEGINIHLFDTAEIVQDKELVAMVWKHHIAALVLKAKKVKEEIEKL